MQQTTLVVRVTPRAKHTQITGWRESMLCIKLAAPPVDGKANEELVRFLASLLGVPKSTIIIASGTSARIKRLSIAGLSEIQIRGLLSPTLL
ncbi:DUF167 domain-containing protein [Patescibacteria group bacterium]|nr:DUF167 domain-containing protein [Patescibacteria group bacterium]